MEVFNNLRNNESSAIALGFFDGVHIAHQELIKRTVLSAKQYKTKSVLLTFKKSPSSIILHREASYITNIETKIKLIEDLGIDEVYILDFEEYKSMKAEDYLKDVLIKHFCPKVIITGFNHTFGLERSGNPKLLSSYESIYKYIEIPPVSVDKILVSSTNIKNAIKEGEIALANKMLNRNFSIKGTVVKGNQIARTLGYKTANIIWEKEIIKPAYGVYFGLATYKGVSYQALINFGIRPSVDKDLNEVLEVNLYGFDGNLYGETIEVEFCSKLRNEIKFDSIEELKNQINEDYKALKNSPLSIY